MARRSTFERLMSKVIRPANPDACWQWTAAVNNVGYAMFRYDNRMWTAHRVMAFERGIIEYDDELEVLHTCPNKTCINPRHLRAGTREERLEKQRKHVKNPTSV